VLVTVTPAALVVMTVRQGTVVLLLPEMRISPVTVKVFPATSVVVMSVVAAGAMVNGSEEVVRPCESLMQGVQHSTLYSMQ
jgi:hypothetical protein